jgi:A/G-specific adenine glycosylase
MPSARFRRRFQSTVTKWAYHNHRDVLWRSESDPYQVLVAEILLQRTRYTAVAQVLPQLMTEFPTPWALAAADEDRLHDLLKPLGISRRSGVLQACARGLIEEHSGHVPIGLDSLLALPGVGNYVARATRAVAFDLQGSGVDSAIGRMLKRVVGNDSTKEVGYDPELWKLAEWLSDRTGRMYFFGLVDIAGIMCLSRPRCHNCPVASLCRFAQNAAKEGADI